MKGIFLNFYFEGNITKWDISNVMYFNSIFEYSELNCDLSDWRNINKKAKIKDMFSKSRYK